MKVAKVTNNSNLRDAYLKKQEERDVWLKTVVKVLRWKDNYFQKVDSSLMEKITSKEWNSYCKEKIKMSVSKGKNQTLQDLKDLEDIIKSNNGFE